MEEQKKDISRRGFMQATIAAVGGVISLALGIPAIAYVVEPALKSRQGQDWLRLGSISKIEPGVPTLFKSTIQQQTGWITSEEEVSVYVLTEDGRDYIAMSNVCTHLGCRVRWISEQNNFICPCHNGVFGKAGEVLDGPPPKPLDRYEVKVENDELFIKMEG